MAHCIFVHGAFANKNSWFGLPEKIEAAGHSIKYDTLPGHNGPFGPLPLLDPRHLIGLGRYVGAVSSWLPDEGPVWLIGHSMGGMAVSQLAAEIAADEESKVKIAGLIYITAMLPAPGDMAVQLMGDIESARSRAKAEFDLLEPGTFEHGQGSQPGRAFFGAFRPPDKAKFKAIPKHFVRCATDGVLEPPIQDEMIGHWPDVLVHRLDSIHFPQLTKAEKLKDIVLEILPTPPAR